jgi:hypothetical protein
MRSYIKLQAICANIGGFIRFLVLAAYIINYPINLKRVNLELMAEIFNYTGNFEDDKGYEICRKTKSKNSEDLIKLKVFFNDEDTTRNCFKNNLKDNGVKNKGMLGHNKTISNLYTSPNEFVIQNDEINLSRPKSNYKLKNNKTFHLNYKTSTINNKSFSVIDELDNSGDGSHKIIRPIQPDTNSEINFPINTVQSSKPIPTVESSNIKADTGEIKKIINEKEVLSNIVHTKLKFTFFQILNSFFCCRKLKTKKVNELSLLYENSLESINKYLNVNILIKKMSDLEKMKMLLFNFNQNLSIDYFQKPKIYLINGKVFKHLSFDLCDNNCSEEEKIKKLGDYFYSKLKNHKIDSASDDLDSKLFRHLDENIKKWIIKEACV